MSGTIAQTTVFANGVLLTVPAGTFTLANGNTQPRYDVLYVVLGATGGSNPTSGNTTTADSGTFGVQPGTPGSSPVKPTLTNAAYCQIGSIYVPANATSLTTGNLNSQDVSPNANGPLPAFSGVQSHIQAAITSSNAVHNIKQGSGNGFDADTVDGLHAAAFDVAGAAAAVSASLATETTNRATADTTLQTNLNTETTNRQNADNSLQTQVNGLLQTRGGSTTTATTDSNGNATLTVTFSPAFPNNALGAAASFINYIPTNATRVAITNLSKTGMTISLGIANNSGSTVQATYVAVGN